MAWDDSGKYIKINKLKEILANLPDDCTVEANQVGNLLISNSERRSVGYIDLLDDKYEAFNNVAS